MEEMKACPFCGGKAEFKSKIEFKPILEADTFYWEQTGCPKCDI